MLVFSRSGVGAENELQAILKPAPSKLEQSEAFAVTGANFWRVARTDGSGPFPCGQVPNAVQFGSICLICAGPTPNLPAGI